MKFTLGFLLGASVGAAVVHYLNSIEGIALVNKVKEDVSEVSDNLNGLADTIVNTGKSFLGKEKERETVERMVLVEVL